MTLIEFMLLISLPLIFQQDSQLEAQNLSGGTMIVISFSLGSQQIFVMRNNTSIATILDNDIDHHSIMVNMLEFLKKLT